MNQSTTTHTVKTTAYGTPCSPAWDLAWIAKIDAIETQRNHRICGARTASGDPCTLRANHENGRCRFHGGFNLTGAPKNNRNAVLHGLYSRQLQTCGPRCHRWNSCPLAGNDIEELPENNRPTCPYEQAQYNAVVTDGLAKFQQRPLHDPLDFHMVHTLATLNVMMTRAATAVTVTRGEDLDKAQKAYIRISSEFRRYYKLLCIDTTKGTQLRKPTPTHLARYADRAVTDTDLTPEGQAAISPLTPHTDKAQPYFERAQEAVINEDFADLFESVKAAAEIDPTNAQHYAPILFAALNPEAYDDEDRDQYNRLLHFMQAGPGSQ